MNRNAWVSRQNRVGCAAAAALACTLVLGSVIWLFADTGTSTASAVASQVVLSADGRVEPQRIR